MSARDLALALIDSFGDPEATAGLLTEDAQWWVTPSVGILASPTTGRDAICAAMKTIYSTLYRDVQTTVHDVIAEGDQAVVRICFCATALFADNRPYENEYCLWVRCRNGRIEQVWEYLDVAWGAAQFRTADGPAQPRWPRSGRFAMIVGIPRRQHAQDRRRRPGLRRHHGQG
jgi:ketosteroid isomerase-like protein